MCWLKRSGSLPLKLSLDTDANWSIGAFYRDSKSQLDFKDPYFDLMHAIATQSYRWKHLCFSFLPPPIFKSFRTLIATDLPLLEKVVESASLIDVANHYRSLDLDSPILSVFQQSPSLRTLRLELVRDSDLERIPLPWSRLTTLQITFTHPATDGSYALQHLSRLCPLLLECALRLYTEVEDPTTSPVPSKEWAHLRKLDLRFTGLPEGAYDSEIRRTFAAITTPALTHLSVAISYTDHAGDNDPDCIAAVENDVPFHNLIERSRCELLSLDIHILLGPTFSKTLHVLPSLSSLTIHLVTLRSNPYNEDMSLHLDRTRQFSTAIQALTPSEGRAACPKLEQIRFMYLRPQHTMLLLALVEARALHTSLMRLSATFGMLPQADIEILKSAQQQAGLRDLGVEIQWEFERDLEDYPYSQRDSSPNRSLFRDVVPIA
ncbi:hypothetical protein V5O48_008117 [Marasmius crinis-equi]|uniref:F-box domain-containing protein n=1 Tax=Marasmius crinis-equi TaxID=585013 RepID=A0ABR3FEY4_9AGAR